MFAQPNFLRFVVLEHKSIPFFAKVSNFTDTPPLKLPTRGKYDTLWDPPTPTFGQKTPTRDTLVTLYHLFVTVPFLTGLTQRHISLLYSVCHKMTISKKRIIGCREDRTSTYRDRACQGERYDDSTNYNQRYFRRWGWSGSGGSEVVGG